MDNELYDNFLERIVSMGLPEAAVARKLAEYDARYESGDRHISARELFDASEDLMTTPLALLRNERSHDELRMTVRNVLEGSDGDEPGKDWVEAEKVLRDATVAYQQVQLGPSETFSFSTPENVDYAKDRLREEVIPGANLDLFYIAEQIFGVDVFVLDSVLEPADSFDAIGGMVCGSPFIVVRRGVDPSYGNEALVDELARILSGNLAWYSDVHSEGSLMKQWELDFIDMLMNAFNGMGREWSNDYKDVRFPARLIDAHRVAVARGENLGYFLNWMAGDPLPVPKHSSTTNLDEAFSYLF
ncbi:MAG TPA: hypothetical protein VLR89_06065 [Anaerolineaceae bacterium]|nr:hypothetical protein [Anaerolineaceae bacterium]HSN94610.1 hypothetical protein [Anaerolineaceae bacterium]